MTMKEFLDIMEEKAQKEKKWFSEVQKLNSERVDDYLAGFRNGAKEVYNEFYKLFWEKKG